MTKKKRSLSRRWRIFMRWFRRTDFYQEAVMCNGPLSEMERQRGW